MADATSDLAIIYDRFLIGDLFSVRKVNKRTFHIERNKGVGISM